MSAENKTKKIFFFFANARNLVEKHNVNEQGRQGHSPKVK